MSDRFIIKRGGNGDSGGENKYFKAMVTRSITEVTADMWQGITSIGCGAFVLCDSLTSVEIPNIVTSIGSYAFSYCTSLTSVEIPNSVTSIYHQVFLECRSLTSVKVKSTTPPTLGSDVFYNTNANLVIYVPATSVDAYKAANNWSTYASKIQEIPSD